MKRDINKAVDNAIKAIEFLKKEESMKFIENAANMIATSFKNGNKILIAGNGGSLCDSMHFAEEFSGYLEKKENLFQPWPYQTQDFFLVFQMMRGLNLFFQGR